MTDYRSPLALEAEARWEIEGINRAVARYREAARHKNPTELPGGQALLRELVGPLSAATAKAQAEAAEQDTRPGGGAETRRVGRALHLLDAEKLAVITLGVALRQSPGEPASVTSMSQAVANAIRAQIEFDRWEEQKDGEAPDAGADKFLRRLADRQPERLRRLWPSWRTKVLAEREGRWPVAIRVALGGLLIRLLLDTAPHRFRLLDVDSPDRPAVLAMTDETILEMQARETRAEVARPFLMPMIVPPNDWQYEMKEAA